MDKAEVIKLLNQLSTPLGYNRKGSLFWKSGDELTMLIHLQKSRWGGGLYVNIGVTPNKMITKSTPPGPGYWGWEQRGESLQGPHRQLFEACAHDDNNEMSPMELAKPLAWVLKWMDSHFSDAEAVRAAARQSRSWMHRTGAMSLMMKDWGAGKLKSSKRYFGGTPYYRHTP